MQLAVTLANRECLAEYSTAPFDSASFPIEFLAGRWQWGHRDPAGIRGYSAAVSFDAFGDDPRVKVFFHEDVLQ